MRTQSNLYLDNAAGALNELLVVSYIQLLFPLNQLLEWFFIHKTKRKANDLLTIEFFNELILFVVII
jgi:hypothetical protein